MKKQLLFGVIVLAGSALMGLSQKVNAAPAASGETVFRLDSLVTKDKSEKYVNKHVYGYDESLRTVYDLGFSFSEWSNPPYAQQLNDSTVYEYDGAGNLIKESYYRFDPYSDSWSTDEYYIYAWNAAGQRIESVYWKYNLNIEDYVDMNKTEYTYGADGSLEVMLRWARAQGRPGDTSIKDLLMEEKTVYSDFLAVDKPRKVESYFYDKPIEPETEGTWRLATYMVNVYDEAQLVDSAKFYSENWETQEWDISAFHVYKYDEAGRVVELGNTTQDYETKEITVTRKTYYEYDADGNLIKLSGESYYKDAWEPTDSQYYYYTRIDDETAVSQVDVKSVEVFFASASQQIEVRAEGRIDALRVFAADGRNVAELCANGNYAALSTADMRGGVYIVSVHIEGATVNRKVYVHE